MSVNMYTYENICYISVCYICGKSLEEVEKMPVLEVTLESPPMDQISVSFSISCMMM